MSRYTEQLDTIRVSLNPSDKQKYEDYFAAIAGSRLFSLCNEEFKSPEYYSVVCDALTLVMREENEVVKLLNPDSVCIAKMMRWQHEMVDSIEAVFGVSDEDIEGEKAGTLDSEFFDFDYDDEEEPKENVGTPEPEEGDEGDPEEYDDEWDPEEDDDEVEEANLTNAKEMVKAIDEAFGGTIENYTSLVMQRYTLLFKSGFDLNKPYGMLSEHGVYYVSGSKCSFRHQMSRGRMDFSTSNKLYHLFADKIGILESPHRSEAAIAGDIVAEYYGSKRVMYFPRKLLEIMTGCESISKTSMAEQRGNEVVGYNKHESGNKWGAYSKYVQEEIKSLISNCVADLAIYNKWKTLTDSSVVAEVDAYLKYVAKCLSCALEVVEYKCSGNTPVSFKFRIADVEGVYAGKDMTPEILKTAFAGNAGASDRKVMSSGLDEKDSSQYGVYEYAHEFNHTLAMAMPLFAYKALQGLQERGEAPTWKTMVMGQGVDGSILRNGEKGVNLGGSLFHHINAGSRAGKGVMTLAFLTSALAAGKIPIYLDNKPDMASLLAYLSTGGAGGYPNGFIMNGSNLEDDKYGSFHNVESWIDKSKIPLEAQFLFGRTDWEWLGDLFYMRAMQLALGIILARGSQNGGVRDDEMFGGHNGIMLVLDEFNVFQTRFADRIMLPIGNNIPPQPSMFTRLVRDIETIDIDESSKTAGRKRAERDLKAADLVNGFGGKKTYALALLNSFADSISYISGKSNAGFSDEEVRYSDIFVIGQNLEELPITRDSVTSATTMGRLNRELLNGLPKNDIGFAVRGSESIPYKMTMFRGSDAIIGYNLLYPNYLKQTDPKSKAFGVLDANARGFAYYPRFEMKDGVRETPGKQLSSLEAANNSGAVYFRPYLLLNNSDPNDRYVSDMFKYAAEAGVASEDILAEYPDEGNDGKISRYVGFADYMQLMGLGNIAGLLQKGADVANEAARRMGYPDSGDGRPLWLQLVLDLRPEWIYSVGDVAEKILNTGRDQMGPKGHIKEYVAYIEAFNKFKNMGIDIRDESLSGYAEGVSGSGSGEVNESGESAYKHSMLFGGKDDGSDPEFEEVLTEETGRRAMGDYGLERDEGIDLFDFDFDDDSEESGKDPLEVFRRFRNKNPIGGVTEPDVADFGEELDGATEEVKRDGGFKTDDWGYTTGEPGIDTGYTPADEEVEVGSGGYGEGFDMVSDDEETMIDSYREFMNSMTRAMIRDFGGMSRIKSIGVCGGAVAVNGVIYRTKVSNSAVKLLPLDVRKQVNSGQIAELLDWRFLTGCNNLAELAFDSTDFVYNCINEVFGDNGKGVDIKWYFSALPGLKRLRIGKNIYLREDVIGNRNYNNPFVQRSRAYEVANVCTSGASKAMKGAWKWGWNNVTGKNNSWFRRIFGGAAGLVAGVATTTAAGVSLIAKGATGAIDKAKRESGRKQHGRGNSWWAGMKDGFKDLFGKD